MTEWRKRLEHFEYRSVLTHRLGQSEISFKKIYCIIMLLCPCGLFRDEVLDLDRRDRVILREGRCQNLSANGEGVCGQPIGAHPGNSILII